MSMPNCLQVVLAPKEGGQIADLYVDVGYKIESMYTILFKSLSLHV